MSGLRIYSGTVNWGGAIDRYLIVARSRAEVARRMGLTAYWVKKYWSDGGTDDKGLYEPGVIYARHDHYGPYERHWGGE